MYKQKNTALKILNYLITTQLNLKLSNIKNKLQKLIQADFASYSIIKALFNVLTKFKITKGNRDNTKY